MLAYLDDLRPGNHGKKRRKQKGKRKSALVLQKTVSPFDAYTYLYARFGAPNGLQRFVARDDSGDPSRTIAPSAMCRSVGDISAVVTATSASVIYYPVERRAVYGGIRASF